MKPEGDLQPYEKRGKLKEKKAAAIRSVQRKLGRGRGEEGVMRLRGVNSTQGRENKKEKET